MISYMGFRSPYLAQGAKAGTALSGMTVVGMVEPPAIAEARRSPKKNTSAPPSLLAPKVSPPVAQQSATRFVENTCGVGGRQVNVRGEGLTLFGPPCLTTGKLKRAAR